MDIKIATVYGIIGLIIDYIVINFGIPYIFPQVTKYNMHKNKLETTIVSVPITSGSCNFDTSMVEINTTNPYSYGFVYMPLSNNMKGGAQFSYSFWLDVKSNSTALKNKVIFYKGLPQKALVAQTNSLPLNVCPLVKFGDLNTNDAEHSSYLEIIFNTRNNPHEKIVLDNNVFNLTKSTNSNPRWFLVTITFQDYIDFSNAEKGIQIQSFINDNLVNTHVIKNDSLKFNKGNVFITPNMDTSNYRQSTNSYYADITYHNYALDIIDIERIYQNGVSNEYGCLTAKYNKTENMKNAYHRLSMYNYLSN